MRWVLKNEVEKGLGTLANQGYLCKGIVFFKGFSHLQFIPCALNKGQAVVWWRMRLGHERECQEGLTSREFGPKPESIIIVVQLLSHVQLFVTSWTAIYQASQVFTLPEFCQNHVHRVGDAIQPSHPLLPPSLPALNLSQH